MHKRSKTAKMKQKKIRPGRGTHAMMALLPLKESKGMTARAYAEVANGIFSKMAL